MKRRWADNRWEYVDDQGNVLGTETWNGMAYTLTGVAAPAGGGAGSHTLLLQTTPAAQDNLVIWQQAPFAITITKVGVLAHFPLGSTPGANDGFQLNLSNGSGSGAQRVLDADLVATPNGWMDTTQPGAPAIAHGAVRAGDELAAFFDAVTGTPVNITIQIDYTLG